MQAAQGEEVCDLLRRGLPASHCRLAHGGRNAKLRIALLGTLTAFTAAVGLVMLGIDRRILAPFRSLQSFAQAIAAGNLDMPLAQDQAGSFGAFTESFDLMRQELAQARESERQANRSKKELVASLSHDIKTPVASIKAVAELMAATVVVDRTQRQLATISGKADQIDALVTNLFKATLEELEALPVKPEGIASTFPGKLIADADYDDRANVGAIPECLVTADPMRLAQVLNNVFENSYKYADTAIEVTAE
jgi:signal transduction histidine kinase